jgi:hypothetical protein
MNRIFTTNLRLSNTQTLKKLRMFDGKFNDLPATQAYSGKHSYDEAINHKSPESTNKTDSKQVEQKKKKTKLKTRLCLNTHLFNFLNLLIKSSNHIVRRVGNLLNFHQIDQRIHLAGKN